MRRGNVKGVSVGTNIWSPCVTPGDIVSIVEGKAEITTCNHHSCMCPFQFILDLQLGINNANGKKYLLGNFGG